MLIYTKLLKEIISKKMKIDEHEIIALGGEYSVAVPNKLSIKLNDPDNFSIPLLIGNISIDRTLCDLSFSVSLMPYSIFTRLDLGDLRPTNIFLH